MYKLVGASACFNIGTAATGTVLCRVDPPCTLLPFSSSVASPVWRGVCSRTLRQGRALHKLRTAWCGASSRAGAARRRRANTSAYLVCVHECHRRKQYRHCPRRGGASCSCVSEHGDSDTYERVHELIKITEKLRAENSFVIGPVVINTHTVTVTSVRVTDTKKCIQVGRETYAVTSQPETSYTSQDYDSISVIDSLSSPSDPKRKSTKQRKPNRHNNRHNRTNSFNGVSKL